MPSVINILTVAASCLMLATSSPMPTDSSPAKVLFDKRADLETCPGIHNKLVRGNRFRVRCDYDTLGNGGRQEAAQAPDFDDCMGKCEGTYRNWCKFVSWAGKLNDPGTCYLKAGNGERAGDSGTAYYVNDSRSKGKKLGIRR